MLFDTEFNGGHFKDKNVKIGWKLELLDWKRQKTKNPKNQVFFEVCSGPYIFLGLFLLHFEAIAQSRL
jgi:hypothetical protein